MIVVGVLKNYKWGINQKLYLCALQVLELNS